jgi:hypothetical protein
MRYRDNKRSVKQARRAVRAVIRAAAGAPTGAELFETKLVTLA